MLFIPILLGTARKGRQSEKVARFVFDETKQYGKFETELIDVRDFGISITEAITALELKEKFIFFDSIDTLLIYNKEEVVLKFIHFLIGRIREWNVKGIIVTVEKTEIIPQLSEFCDKVIYLKK